MPEYELDHGIFRPVSAARSAIRAQAQSAQTAFILSIEDTNGAQLSGFDKRGALFTPSLTALATTDFAISAAWGNTATVSAVTTNSNDQAGGVSVTAGGAGLAVGGTITLTFKVAWSTTPRGVICRGDGVLPGGDMKLTTLNTTTLIATFDGLPVAGNVYLMRWVVL